MPDQTRQHSFTEDEDALPKGVEYGKSRGIIVVPTHAAARRQRQQSRTWPGSRPSFKKLFNKKIDSQQYKKTFFVLLVHPATQGGA